MPHQSHIQKNGPLLTLIIAVYKKPDFLEKIFLSLKNQTFHEFEIIIADDGSGDEIKNLVKKYAHEFYYPVQHIRHRDNGFRKTIIINKASRFANASFLVFIDGDSILHHRFLEYHYKRKRIGRVCTGRRVKFRKRLTEQVDQKDVTEKRIQKIGYWIRACNKSGRKHGFFIPGMFYIRNIFRKKFTILGANFSVHKCDFEKINGYDERITGRGLEDNNLDIRFKKAGIRVRSLAHEALQYHLYHSSQPIPHSDEVKRQFKNSVDAAWTPCGIYKNET